jgi:selenocysteine lyase/cysteine desulfurase
VAVTAASGAVGTCPDVAGITARAHAVGALAFVDASHLAVHARLDRAALGADFLALSVSSFCGPHVGAVVAEPALLAGLEPERLLPTPDRVPDRFESASVGVELLAGVPAAVEHLAALSGDATGSRRERLAASMGAVVAYERPLFEWLREALGSMRHVQVLGDPVRSIPVLSFTVARMRPRQVAAELSRRGIAAWDGDAWARELFDALGANEHGGAVQLGLLHYNTADEVGYVIDSIAELRPR